MGIRLYLFVLGVHAKQSTHIARLVLKPTKRVPGLGQVDPVRDNIIPIVQKYSILSKSKEGQL